LDKAIASKPVAAPKLPYRPVLPRRYRPPIALIGAGGIAEQHLKAYRDGGLDVVAICNRTIGKAERRREEFFPDAEVYSDYRDVLRRDDVEVVDVTPHPADRIPIVRDAIRAGKHVLSQKPFVLDLSAGERLVELAEKHGVKLAVNQNGRWAPHFSYMRQAIARGLVGEVIGAHLSVHWNHNWIKGKEFENVRHIILFDFGIHWFDILTAFMPGRRARRVYASFARSPSQTVRPALLGQALIEYDDAQATLAFDADSKFGSRDQTYLACTEGTLYSTGPSLTEQAVTIYTKRGHGTPKLEGSWFPDGFLGAMGELLCAVEEGREPGHGARGNLDSLALCFAAVASAESHRPQVPGKVRRVPGA
jgi:predicted dehydrogenase